MDDFPEVVPGEPLFLTARAKVRLCTEDDEQAQDILEAISTAARVPIITDGQPTKLLVDAWLVHEGKNNNRQVFHAEDFPEAAAMITPPNLLPMDWNHGAVHQHDGEARAIGAWYAAAAEFDPEAYDGRGAEGIRTKGIVWAWAFPEHAAAMLEMQQVRGYVEFSMACIPTSVETGRDHNGSYVRIKKPIFFTNSALNVPPADPDAKGHIENAHSLLPSVAVDGTGHSPQDVPLAAAREEESMIENDPVQETSVEAVVETPVVVAEEQEQLPAVTEQPPVVAELPVLAELQGALQTMTARAEDAELQRDALQAELETAVTQIRTLTEQLESAQAQVAAFEAARDAAVVETRWESRFAELPESYRTAFARRSEDEQKRFKDRWAVASDEAWTEFKGDLFVGFADMKVSYLKLSEQEGDLPSGSERNLSQVLISLIK
jgi:hypothetical protein